MIWKLLFEICLYLVTCILYFLNGMFGFGKKKIEKKEKISDNIFVIPEEFYGAKDPSIHYETTSKTVFKETVKFTNKSNNSKVVSGKISRLLKNKKSRYIIIGLLLVLAVAFISWYYIEQARVKPVVLPEHEEIVPVVEVVEEPIAEEEPLVEEVEETPIIIPEVEEKPVLQFPNIILTDSTDIDSDALTDVEEELFNTDSGTWATDGDGYYDGQEVINLYNPTGFAPMKLIDAGLVQEYVNPILQYRVFFPIQWLMGEVDSKASQVLFSSISGDYVEIFVSEKDPSVTFAEWFGKEIKDQNFADLEGFSNRFQEEGWKRKDGLVAYFINDTKVYVIIYHTGSTGFLSFRHVMQMMLQSFRPSKTLIDIPEQVILPTESGLTEVITTLEDLTPTATDVENI